jgi:hypothetical protein
MRYFADLTWLDPYKESGLFFIYFFQGTGPPG